MIRRMVLALLALAVLMPVPALAQPEDELHIFMVVWRDETDVEHGFRAYLRERGIRARYTLRNLDRDRGRIPEIVEEIRATQPDLVHTWGTSTTLGIFGPVEGADPDKVVRGIPGVFSLVAYPVAAGIVRSFAETGRPVTGTAFLPSITAQIRTLQSYLPFRRLGVIYNPLERNSTLNVEELRMAAAAGDFTLIEAPVPPGADGKADPGAIPALVRHIAREKADVLYSGPDSFLGLYGGQITRRAADAGIPTFAVAERGFAESEAMIGFTSRYFVIGRLAGSLAERILLDRVPPDQIPVARLSRYTLSIRMPVARELEIYPPIGLLRVAEIVDTESQ